MHVQLLLIGLAFAGITEQKDFDQAVKDKTITATIRANPLGSHYANPVNLTIRSFSHMEIVIRPGMMFIPDNDSLQNIMFTEEMIVQVKPGEPVTIPVQGMCTELGDRGAKGTESYTFGGYAKQDLRDLADFANRNKYTGHVLQEAIWAMATDELEYLSGYDTTVARVLTEYLAAAMKKPVPPPPAADDYENNYYAETPLKVEVSGEVEFSYPWPIDVVIALYNEDNILVRELHNQTQMPKGYHKLEYAFDASVYTADNYVIKTYLDNELAFENSFTNRRR